jgi:uncharacterized membrane protein YjjB (DUF3815 family)
VGEGSAIGAHSRRDQPAAAGLTAYRGFYELSVEGLTDGLVTITLALAIGLALAAGVTLGQFHPGRR